MTPIVLSNCPKTGYQRKVTTYNFLWYREVRQIIVDCLCNFYDTNNKEITNLAGRKQLVASDTLVNPVTGAFLTPEQLQHNKNYNQLIAEYNAAQSTYTLQLASYQTEHTDWLALDPETWPEGLPFPPEPQEPNEPTAPHAIYPSIGEYDFYVYVFGMNPIILPDVITGLIQSREYRFDELITLK